MRIIIRVVIILAIIGGVIGGMMTIRNNKAATEKLPVVTTEVAERGAVGRTAAGTGFITPHKTIEVKSEVPGEIIEMSVELGEIVTAGQVIAKIDPVVSQTGFNQAKADWEAAIARVEQAKTTLELQSRLIPNQIEEARQQLVTSKAQFEQSVKGLEIQEQQSEASISQSLEQIASSQSRLRQVQLQVEIQPELNSTSIRQAKATLDGAVEGLLQLEKALQPQARAAANSAVEQGKANTIVAEQILKRQKDLLGKGYVSKAEVEQAQSQFDVARATLNNVQKKLDTLQSQQETELRTSNAKIAQSKAALDSAVANAHKQEKLFAEDLITAQANVRQSEAALQSAYANARQVELKQLDVLTSEASVKRSEASLETALANSLQEKLKASDIVTAQAQVERAFAALENAKKQLAETIIIAPRDGTIVQKFAEVGDMVQSGSRGNAAAGQGVGIVQIADMSIVYVDCQVDESEIASIEEDQLVDILVDAFPSRFFEGTVTRIDPQTTVQQNVTYIHVQVEIDLGDPRLKPGMSATCDFIVERKEDVLMVSSDAIRMGEELSTVDVLLETPPDESIDETRVLKLTYKDEQQNVKNGWILTHNINPGLVGDQYTEIVVDGADDEGGIAASIKEGDIIVTSIIEQEEDEGGRGGFGRMMRGGGGR